MKKNTSHIWMAAIGVVAAGGVGIWAYEKYYAATTLAPGAMTVTTPSSGTASLALPSGAKSWTSAAYVSLAGATAIMPTVPTSPTTHLTQAVVKGSSLTVMWVDSTGTAQTTIVSFN
jgi:hypothetical protein